MASCSNTKKDSFVEEVKKERNIERLICQKGIMGNFADAEKRLQRIKQLAIFLWLCVFSKESTIRGLQFNKVQKTIGMHKS